MDRTDILSRLKKTELHVALGDAALERHREAIAALRKGGGDTVGAEATLSELEKRQAALMADRRALLAQLAVG